jgi:hypothetical protein
MNFLSRKEGNFCEGGGTINEVEKHSPQETLKENVTYINK